MLGNGLRAYRQSVTKRKHVRKLVRQELGTSSDPANDVFQSLRAAMALKELVALASGGTFGLAVYDFRTNDHRPIGEVIVELQQEQHREKRIADELKARFSETA